MTNILIEGRILREKRDFITRFNRWLAVPTLVLFIVLAVTGYGITNPAVVGELTGGLLSDRTLSSRIHNTVVFPALVLLMIHILIALRSALLRWGVEDGNLLKAFLILLGIFAMTLLVLMQYLTL